MTVRHRDLALHAGKTRLEAFNRLRSQGNFRNEDQAVRPVSSAAWRMACKINLGLSAAGHAIE